MFGRSIVEYFQFMQAERNAQEYQWDLSYRAYAPEKRTLDEKINDFIKDAMGNARRKAAKRLAGGEWPED